MNPHWLESFAVFFGIGYLIWNVVQTRPRPFGSFLTWRSDVLIVAGDARRLRERFRFLQTASPSHQFLIRLSTDDIAKQIYDPTLTAAERDMYEWRKDLDTHLEDIGALCRAYQLWTHFRFPRPMPLSLPLGSTANWDKELLDHEGHVREWII